MKMSRAGAFDVSKLAAEAPELRMAGGVGPEDAA